MKRPGPRREDVGRQISCRFGGLLVGGVSVRQASCRRSPASNPTCVTLVALPLWRGRGVPLLVTAVDLFATRVRFRDSGGVVVDSDLRSVSAAALAASLPWRTFRWHRGQAHYSGWYWAATMSRHVVYESRLELARLLLADFDPQVMTVAAQPFYLTACVDGRERNHVPDFLLVGSDAVVTVVNVKPADRLADPKVAAALAWAGAVFAERGWRHEIWTGTSGVLLANVRFLAGYRNPARLDTGLVSVLTETMEEPIRLGEVEQAWRDRSEEARAAALHLLWSGVLRADLSVPLSAETVLERAA